jgi:hypothetical protein
LPDDWIPDEKDSAFARKHDWSAEKVSAEAAKFMAYHLAKGSLMLNWHRAWQTWVLNERGFRRAPTPSTGRFPTATPTSTGVTYREFKPEKPVELVSVEEMASRALALKNMAKVGNGGT